MQWPTQTASKLTVKQTHYTSTNLDDPKNN